jgi:hypothetical protein
MAKTEISVRVKEGHLCKLLTTFIGLAGAGSVAFNVNGFDSYCWRLGKFSRLSRGALPALASAVVFVVF